MKKSKDYSFYENVYEVVRLVPRGRVTSYGAIAQYLGETRSARLVGYAMNQVVDRDDIPAHRVVNRLGRLTGAMHFVGRSMKDRLQAEGVLVEDDIQILNFATHFWNPSQEL